MAVYYPDTLLPAPPHLVGPTWRRYDHGGWFMPEASLGWGVLNWMFKYLRSPGGDGGPFIPTFEQARFIVWWYAVDETGRFAYREGVLRRMKGWGKDPLAAALALAELCGPVAFSHFDSGRAVGKTRNAAWVEVAAVSQDQTKNTFLMFPILISPLLKQTYGLEVNKFVIYSAAGGHIEAVTARAASMDGHRPTFVIQNEIQWWGVGPGGEVNEGHEMAEMIEGNITKVPGARKLSICNAHRPGDDSVAEKYYNKWQDVEAGEALDTGTLYDALEAPADTPISEIPWPKDDPEGYEAGFQKLLEGLRIARGDSVWLPIEEIILSVLDAANEITESRRKFLNQINASEDAWISPTEWDSCQILGLRPLARGDRITLGFDGSKAGDHTALTACRVDDGALFLVKTWVPDQHPQGQVPRRDVDAYVRSMFQKYDVVAFRADVKEFESYVDQWGQDFRRKMKVNASPGHPIAFDMRGNQKQFALDVERFLDEVQARGVRHDGNRVLRQHVLNAHRHPTIYDAFSIRKASKDSSRKIDAAVTAVLAWGARQEFLMSKTSRGRGAAVMR